MLLLSICSHDEGVSIIITQLYCAVPMVSMSNQYLPSPICPIKIIVLVTSVFWDAYPVFTCVVVNNGLQESIRIVMYKIIS